jgi:hypothetical protein
MCSTWARTATTRKVVEHSSFQHTENLNESNIPSFNYGSHFTDSVLLEKITCSTVVGLLWCCMLAAYGSWPLLLVRSCHSTLVAHPRLFHRRGLRHAGFPPADTRPAAHRRPPWSMVKKIAVNRSVTAVTGLTEPAQLLKPTSNHP